MGHKKNETEMQADTEPQQPCAQESDAKQDNMDSHEDTTRTIAAIDIGSNAVRLLIKKINIHEDHTFDSQKLLMLRYPLRLGFDVFGQGRISDSRAKTLCRLLKAYRQLMKIYNVDSYQACATSAMRDASNGHKIIRYLHRETNIKIQIIDGISEARLIFNNNLEHQGAQDQNYLYVDVGGGSTEVNLVSRNHLIGSYSYNIGTIRLLLDTTANNQFDKLTIDMEDLRDNILNDAPIHIVGSGGNINKIYRLIGQKNENHSIDISDLEIFYEKLNLLSVEERMSGYDLKSDRADVIVPAAKIFITIANAIGARDIYVPVIGLSDGLIDAMILEEFPTSKRRDIKDAKSIEQE